MSESLGASARRAGVCPIFQPARAGVFKDEAAVVRFFKDDAERDDYRLSLKQRRCPHCALAGFVICHGFLRGYGAAGAALAIRGFRFLCSNRRRRQGCGRTYSILLAYVLPRRYTPAPRVRRGS